MKFQMFKLVFEKAEEPEIKLSTFVGSWIKEQNYRKTSTSASLTSLNLCVGMRAKSLQSWLTLFQPLGLQSARLLCPWDFPGKNTGVGSLSLLQGNLSNPGIKPRSPTLQVDSLPAEPQGKPKNTGVGSLSLPQRIFPIQELNQGLLHCRQIL